MNPHLLPLFFAATAVASTSENLSLTWENPSEFRDIADSWNSSDRQNERVLGNLKRSFEKVVSRRLEAGKTLELRVTEVDVEGEFEPYRGHGYDEVRIVKDLYPARLEFTYRLLDAEGGVIAEGEERLRQRSLFRLVTQNERFPYTVQLFEDWLRSLPSSPVETAEPTP